MHAIKTGALALSLILLVPAVAAQNVSELTRARQLMAAKKDVEAAKILTALTAKNPGNADAALALGEIALRKKDYGQARTHLRSALRLSRGGAVGQKANTLLLAMPRNLVKPKTGGETRMIASMLGLGRTRGGGSMPTVINFSASWCQPCKQLDSVIGRYKTNYADKISFMKVDVDDPGCQTLLDQYDVSPIPTVVYLDSAGEVVTYSVGFSGENTVKDGIDKILTR